MIVVDTNVIAYLFLPADNNTRHAERLVETDDHWVAPMLWRREFRNILALYLRKDIVDFPTALEIQSQAESLMDQNEFSLQSSHALSLVDQSACSVEVIRVLCKRSRIQTHQETVPCLERKKLPIESMNC